LGEICEMVCVKCQRVLVSLGVGGQFRLRGVAGLEHYCDNGGSLGRLGLIRWLSEADAYTD
jgi:hypothetical protein